MSGWKTWTAGIGTILLGVGQVALAVSNPEAGTDVSTGVHTVLGGLAIIGIGHKIEKAS